MSSLGSIAIVFFSIFAPLSFQNFASADTPPADTPPPCYLVVGTTITDGSACTGDIVIGSEITDIGTRAFDPFFHYPDIAEGITSVDLSATSITSIGDHVFSNNRNLTSVIFPAGLLEIGDSSFAGDQNLTTVNFPNSLTSIGPTAFCMVQLTTIDIPDGVTTIGDSAFVGDTALRSLSIGTGLRIFNANPFDASYSGQLSVNGDNKFLKVVDGRLFTLVDGNPGVQLTGISQPSEDELPVGENPGSSKGEGLQQVTNTGGTSENNSPQSQSSSNGISPGGDQQLSSGAIGTSTNAAVTVTAGTSANSQVASIPPGAATATFSGATVANAAISFSSSGSTATATVVPVTNPTPSALTPFTSTGGFAIVDIQVSGITGPVTVCLDGSAIDHLFHYTGGVWLDITTGHVSGQVCGVTSTFSPFGAGVPQAIAPVILTSKPTSPSNVTASLSNGTATVSFTPGSSGNLPTFNQIDMYINGQLAGNVCNVTGATSCPISNLGPDATFSFTVTAINSKGSAVSTVSNTVSYSSPAAVTTTTTVPPVKQTITCIKVKTTKKITSLSPVCPADYKKK